MALLDMWSTVWNSLIYEAGFSMSDIYEAGFSMKDLFDSVTPSAILLYVRAIGLFFKMRLDILP